MTWVLDAQGSFWTFYLSSVMLAVAFVSSLMVMETKPMVKKPGN